MAQASSLAGVDGKGGGECGDSARKSYPLPSPLSARAAAGTLRVRDLCGTYTPGGQPCTPSRSPRVRGVPPRPDLKGISRMNVSRQTNAGLGYAPSPGQDQGIPPSCVEDQQVEQSRVWGYLIDCLIKCRQEQEELRGAICNRGPIAVVSGMSQHPIPSSGGAPEDGAASSCSGSNHNTREDPGSKVDCKTGRGPAVHTIMSQEMQVRDMDKVPECFSGE